MLLVALSGAYFSAIFSILDVGTTYYLFMLAHFLSPKFNIKPVFNIGHLKTCWAYAASTLLSGANYAVFQVFRNKSRYTGAIPYIDQIRI